VYQALEKIEFVKVAAVLLLIIVASLFAISADAWADAPQIVTNPGIPSEELGFALLLGAMAFAGAGGGQNLCQSNWIRDKRFGMGAYVPRIVSPVTGHPEAAPSTGFVFEPTPENLGRWRRWWRFANIEQLTTFVSISFLCILFTSLLAYATVFGEEGLASDISFLQVEGNALNDTVGGWFGTFFWIIGAFSLFAAALGIVDYVARLLADVVHVEYSRDRGGWSESRLYFTVVWSMVVIGSAILLLGFDQPLVLLTISTVLGGAIMFVYSCLLLITNRRYLSGPVALSGYRIGIVVVAIVVLGVTTAIVGIDQFGNLL
jgi:hypothetical protein